ncbi:MAG: hypothetical protein H6670_14900 [Anaerolineaceae bacterium]|nr:hypothetical protein [Anaerolineae bacterium]MCB9460939.1 hypothetical protein [Anaerolineaceae bacterium]
MVHALQEVHRVLVPDGYMIDLRPVGIEYALEVVAGEQVISVGNADAAGRAARDQAANQAVEQIQALGLFIQEAHTPFSLYTYFPSPIDYSEHLLERGGSTQIEDDTLANAVREFEKAGTNAQFRARHSMIISRYCKQDVPSY